MAIGATKQAGVPPREARSDLVPITGLWEETNGKGQTFLSGVSGSAKYLVLPNNNKKPGSKDPDYHLCVARPNPKKESEE